MSDDLDTLTNAVRDLVDPIRREEDRWVWTPSRHRRRVRRTIIVPSLLDQLRELGEWPYGAGGPPAGTHHQRPDRAPTADGRATATAATLDGIRHWSRTWTQMLHLHKSDTLDAELRGLVVGAWSSPLVIVGRLARSGQLWVARARQVVDWRDSGDRVEVRRPLPCPDCAAPTLIVHLDAQSAACGSCGASWGPRTIGILARRLADVGREQRPAS